MAVKCEQLLEAARRAGSWFVSRQTGKGNYIGNEPVDSKGIYPDTHDVGCYYKSIYFLRSVGEAAAAAKAMNYVVASFMSKDGDFYNTPEVRTSGSYTPNFCQLYPNMWLLRGAVMMGWYKLYRRIVGFLMRYRDSQTGGFYATVNPSTKVIDSNATGYGALCCLIAGEEKAAFESIEMILKMIDEQPDSDRMYLRWEQGKGYLADLSNVPDKQLLYHVIDAKKPAQAYWCWAWPMNTLIGMYEYTGQKRYLDGAIRIYDFLAGCHENAFAFTTAGKGGWGSSMLYRITSDRRYLRTAMSQMEWILAAQHNDGYMLGPGAKNIDDQPLRTTYDYTADFSTWLVGTAIELAGRI
ncbi:MAG: hypothetical protein ABIG61_09130 [Planctomycetota bacterium]